MSDVTLWWITLGVGLVVIVVAVSLLVALLRSVERVGREVRALWEAAGQAAANTSTSWMLGVTSERLDEVEEELSAHRVGEGRVE